MQIELTAEQQEIIRRAIDHGRLRQPEDAIREALELWIERERTRDEILAEVDEAEASLVTGEGIFITKELMTELAEEIKRRGRERLSKNK